MTQPDMTEAEIELALIGLDIAGTHDGDIESCGGQTCPPTPPPARRGEIGTRRQDRAGGVMTDSLFTWESKFPIGTQVMIDSDNSLIGVITAIILRLSATSYEVSYIHNGISYAPCIEEFRISQK